MLESGALAALAARLETVAAEHGFQREKRRWSGHLTIGRAGDRQLAAATRDALNAARDREFGVSRIESLTLYRSHLSTRGRQLRSARDLPCSSRVSVPANMIDCVRLIEYPKYGMV